jgi:DNA-binding MarR family transcriptional regulator
LRYNVEKQSLFELKFEIWLLIADLHHKILLVRQKELSQYHISTRQLHVLRLIAALGTEANISEIAKRVERKHDVISRQVITMEKDGLIKRMKASPKSRLLALALTEKGRDMLKINHVSEGMDEVMSVLTEDELRILRSTLNRVFIKLNQYTEE